jgi:hypothetical protein
VSGHLLHGRNIGPRIEQVANEGAPEIMRRYAFNAVFESESRNFILKSGKKSRGGRI